MAPFMPPWPRTAVIGLFCSDLGRVLREVEGPVYSFATLLLSIVSILPAFSANLVSWPQNSDALLFARYLFRYADVLGLAMAFFGAVTRID